MRDAATVQRPLSVFKVNSPFTVPLLLKCSGRHIKALFNSVKGINTQKNGSPGWFEKLPLCCFTFTTFKICTCLSSLLFLFLGGYLFSSLSSPKGFPSASDYLWQQLVCWQLSGPVWRLRSRSSPQTSQRTWGEGRWAGQRVNWLGWLH